jgi:L-ribulose-5-phosphate 4-epimerase
MSAIPFSDLRERVCEVNRQLVEAGLVVLGFGNASGIDRDRRVMAIKRSGTNYPSLRPDDLVVVVLADGLVVDGWLHASSDTPAHLEFGRLRPRAPRRSRSDGSAPRR